MDAPYNLESENDLDKTTSKTIADDVGEAGETHSVISASSSESSGDPTNYEVNSIASSVEERLTYVQLYAITMYKITNSLWVFLSGPH